MSEKIYSSRICDTYLKLIRAKYPHVDIDLILQYAGMEPAEVADPGYWFTQTQINLFYERIVQLTGNENIAREAGRYAASPEALGAMRQYTLGMIGPARAFSMMSKLSKNFSKSSEYSSKKISNNVVEVTTSPLPGTHEEEFQCKNRIGFFEALVMIFNYSAPVIEHPECMFKGDKACRYVLKWQQNPVIAWTRARNYFAAGALAATSAAFMHSPFYAVMVGGSTGLLGTMILSLGLETNRRKEISLALEQLWDSSDQLAEQVGVNYRNTQLSREVGEVISTQTNVEAVISSIIHVLQKTLDFDRGLILLNNEKTQKLETRGGFGYTREHLGLIERTTFSTTKSKGPFVIAFRQKKPVMVNDVSDIEDSVTEKSLEFMQALGIKSFIAVPIIRDGESIGVLAVDNLRTKRPLFQSDVNLLMGVVPAIGVSLTNAQLIEARQEQHEATLKVLAESIDARDFLTAGHSEKVAEFSVGIAKELGQSPEFIQMIRVAALLHDYGKISIPDSILKKDGKLTDEERSIIQTHSSKTREILESVPFEGIFDEIPAITEFHHERWDGDGYPRGLKGIEIPFGARIIAAADFLEAITSKRHYRDPMTFENAIQIMVDESGHHFDPKIVRAFLRYLEQHKICLIDEKARREYTKGKENDRFAYRTQVSAQTKKRTLAGTSFDLSLGGVFVRTTDAKEVKKGQELTVTLTLPSPQELMRLNGKIAWVNTGNPLSSDKYPEGFGVEFTLLPDGVKQNLELYLREVSRQEEQYIVLPPHNSESLH